MKDYSNYNIEDFAADDTFIEWCLHPNEGLNRFWGRVLLKYPQQQNAVLEAKKMVLSIRKTEENTLDFEEESEMWDAIEAATFEAAEPAIEEKMSEKRLLARYLPIAASLAVLIGCLWFFTENAAHESNITTSALVWTILDNDSGLEKTVLLSDGSSVVLEPFSSLRFPKTFTGEQRPVVLEGEAFFDIATDSTKPFMVYANETITQVLGTSFTIKAFEGEETVEVDVKTGKVAVYAKVGGSTNITAGEKKEIRFKAVELVTLPRPNKKLVITPNQRVVFDRKIEALQKTLSRQPQIIIPRANIQQFSFENESVVHVFERIGQAYGIALKYDKKALQNCTITTKLDDEPLVQKLNIICAALNLKVEEQEGTIYISGKGCS